MSIVNGDFETGDITGWTIPITIDSVNPRTGIYCAKVKGSANVSYIDQHFSPAIAFNTITSFGFYVKGTIGQQIMLRLIFTPYATVNHIYTLTTSNYEYIDILSDFPGEVRNLDWFRIQTYGETQFEYYLIDDTSLLVGAAEKITNGGFETGDFTGWHTYSSIADFTIRTITPDPHGGTYYLRISGTRSDYVWQPVSIPVNSINDLSVWFFATGETGNPCTTSPTSILVALNLALYGPLSYTRFAQLGENNWEEVDIKAVIVAAGVSNSDIINEIYLGYGSDSGAGHVDIDDLGIVSASFKVPESFPYKGRWVTFVNRDGAYTGKGYGNKYVELVAGRLRLKINGDGVV